MKLSPETWHKRYTEQARWTQAARNYLFSKAGLDRSNKILEVGCGTGAILGEIIGSYQPSIYGLDISMDNLSLAKKYAPGALLQQADAQSLPYRTGSFNLVYTHYVLLWLNDPLTAVREMRRVAKPGSFVLALAEPDYGGQIDNPPELGILGEWQAISLRLQGADPSLGRKLGELFLNAGLENIQSGVIGGEWQHQVKMQVDQTEWEIISSDLDSVPEAPPYNELQHLKEMDLQARKTGIRVLYVPTFYAIGMVPG